jgi:hypothetical protein
LLEWRNCADFAILAFGAVDGSVASTTRPDYGSCGYGRGYLDIFHGKQLRFFPTYLGKHLASQQPGRRCEWLEFFCFSEGAEFVGCNLVSQLFFLRAAGFLLPCYIMARAMNILQRRRQRQVKISS